MRIMQSDHRNHRLVVRGALALVLASVAWVGEAAADIKLTLTTWRIEPSMVKENQTWTVKLWVGNLGNEPPKKGFTVQVLGCDKEYAKCDKVYATQEIKAGTPDLAPGKLPGREVVMEIKEGLPKGEHFIQIAVDVKKELGDTIRKQVRVPVTSGR
jgi:hypothetical protein